MKIPVVVFTCLVIGHFSFAQTPAGMPNKKEIQAFKNEIQALNDLLKLPGLSIAIVKGDKIVYRQMEGFADLDKKIPITNDNLFLIASVTKTFTAALMMQYEQDKKISIQDYALNYRFIDTWFGWPFNIDPNARIIHFLSHTSEGEPGNNFVYNGQRFNYIYGVFEKAGGYSQQTDAYSSELKKRIFEPLHMDNSVAGFPGDRRSQQFSRMAKPYIYHTDRKQFLEDTLNYKWTKAFPATGILSTIDDLAKYTVALDNNQLVSADSYKKMTTPSILKGGDKSPYGIGWFSENYEGREIHWHYGNADAYASLLVRIPSIKMSFILLSNSSTPSNALRLGEGNILQSPFVIAFMKFFVFPPGERKVVSYEPDLQKTRADFLKIGKNCPPYLYEELLGQAMFRWDTENLHGSHTGEAKKLLQLLYEVNPERFDKFDAGIIYMLANIEGNELYHAMERQVRAYEARQRTHPYVNADIAKYFEKQGMKEKANYFHQKLADSNGFEVWSPTIDACIHVGQYLISVSKIEEGRRYYWRAINYMKMNYASDEQIKKVIALMNDDQK